LKDGECSFYVKKKTLKVLSIHEPTVLRIIGQVLIIQLQWVMKMGKERK
jgi:hypothetical protein